MIEFDDPRDKMIQDNKDYLEYLHWSMGQLAMYVNNVFKKLTGRDFPLPVPHDYEIFTATKHAPKEQHEQIMEDIQHRRMREQAAERERKANEKPARPSNVDEKKQPRERIIISGEQNA